MARCRTLIKENDELGKQISQGRVAKLEGEIALEKRLVQEIKAAQNGADRTSRSSQWSAQCNCNPSVVYIIRPEFLTIFLRKHKDRDTLGPPKTIK